MNSSANSAGFSRKIVLPILAVVAATLTVLYSNCSRSPALVPLNNVDLASVPTQSVQVNFCAPTPIPQKSFVKTLIIFDHSGSNKENYQLDEAANDGGPVLPVNLNASFATDPTGHLRYGTPTTPGTLLNYLYTLANPAPAPTVTPTPAPSPSPTPYFALIDFNSNITTYPANSAGFTSDLTAFYNYVLTDSGQPASSPQDSGDTDYIQALTTAYNIIYNDIQQAKNCAAEAPTAAPSATCPVPGQPTLSSYMIVFMSDGAPIIGLGLSYGTNGQIVQNPLSPADCPLPNVLLDSLVCMQSKDEILGEVGSIMSLASEEEFVAGVNLFGIYYYDPGNVDVAAQSLIQAMAQAGNGAFFSLANTGATVDYSTFQPPQKVIPYDLAATFVTNASGVWWTDGKFHVDTDGDGLPDDVETAWGSNPNKADTGNTGVNDLVKYQFLGGASGGAFSAINPFAGGQPCAGMTKNVSSDPDGLNDCEKTFLGDQAGVGLPDSNIDLIPDWLEYRNQVPFQVGQTPAVNAPQLDGYSIFQKIMYSLPANFPVTDMPNVVPANYSLNLVSTTNNQNCYNLSVTNFPIATTADKVRVDIEFKSPLLDTSYIYHVGKKSFVPGSNTLIFNDWTNATEITNNTWSNWP